MLAVALHVDVEPALRTQRVDERVDGTVARTGQPPLLAVDLEMRSQLLDGAVGGVVLRAMPGVRDRQRRGNVLAVEHGADLGRGQLLAGRVRDLLDHLAEFDLQKPRQREPVLALEEVGNAPLAGLTVDADHRVIRATNVRRIDRQIRDVPDRIAASDLGGAFGEPLLDRVLVRARKRGEHEVAAVGMPGMDRQLVAVLDRPDDLVDVGEIDAGLDALREKIKPERNEADVARALAVAEKAALDPLRACKQRELGRRNTAAAIVVRMHGQHDRIAPGEPPRHPFDLISIDVRRRHLDGRGQVDDDLARGCRLPDVVDGVADLGREIELGAGEALGRILEHPIDAGTRRRALADQLRTRTLRYREYRRDRARTRRAAASSRSSCTDARSRA